MDYKGFKSQALDFNVYSDGISVIAVTPQYALTRENNGTQYYSTSGWKGLTIATTIEGALKDTSDAWWSGAAFETLLNQYWDKNNTYPNTFWTREKTEYSTGNPTYSTPIKDTGGSAVGQWCLENDRTIINGAHIGTGTIDADSIKSNSITTTQLAASVLSAKNIKASTLSAITSNMGTLSVGKIQSQNYAPGTPILWNKIDTNGEIDTEGSQGLAYELSVYGDYYSVVGIGGCTDRNPLTIPSTYKSLPVRYIGNQAFENCRDLVNVVIPNSIIGIGEAAFNFCASLTSVTIPDSVESIGEYAFHECSSLTTVSVPDTLQTLGDYAFDACSSLTTTTQDNIRYIGNENNPYLIALDTDSTTITQVTISDRCKFIHAKAFINCHTLETISIPNSVIGIGSSAFYISGTSLRYNIKDNVKYLGNETNLYLVAMSSEDNTAATLTIADGCKFIYVSAFNSNGSLTSVTIPESVTSIGDMAFYECSKLTNINIPDSVKSIGNYAFHSCSGLTSITIPNSITSIGGFAFAFCGGLTSVTIPDSVKSIGNYAFEGCGRLTDITIPDGVTSIGRSAFYNCRGLVNITIPNAVTIIREGTFQDCISLAEVTIPRSVVKLESNVFQGCTSLTSIYFEGSEEEWTLLSADANVPATAVCYYYTDTKPVTSVDSYWCYSPTRGFQISTDSRNMIDSQYFKVSQDGKITATSGKIGGFAMDANSIASGSTTEGTGIRLTSGQTGTGKVIEAGTNFSVDASGNIEAEGGIIGGWEIDGNKKTLSSGKGTATVGLNAAGNTTTPTIWAGSASAGDAPFRVYPTGKLFATQGEIGGFTVNTNSIASMNANTGVGIKLTSGQTGAGKVIEAGTKFTVYADGDIAANGGYIGNWEIVDNLLKGTTNKQIIRLDPSRGVSAYDVRTLGPLTFPFKVSVGARLPNVLDITEWTTTTDNDINLTSRSNFCGTQIYSLQALVPQWVQTGYTFTDPADGSDGENVTGIWFGCANATKPFYGFNGKNAGGGGGLYLDTVSHTVCLDAYGHTDSSNNIGVNKTSPSGLGKIRGSWTAAACLGTNSDANLKHEIESLSDEYTSLFDNLKPVRFKYNDGTSNRYHTGFIAQDVEQAIINSGLTTNAVAGYIKEADTVDENGTVTKEGARSIRYGEFVALNTDQIQKLKTRVVELETSKAELEADIVELKTSVAELTKLLNEKFNQA